MDPRLAANRALWDEWTPIHVRSAFYDVEGWKAGTRDDLYPLLVTEVGDMAGKDLLHLQCHFGLDTLAWARRGARVTGVDFSEQGIEQARRLAAETGLDGTFVVSDVADLTDNLEGDLDVVFTSFGALNWLPDLPRWAEVVAHFGRPGGFFYIAEAHPFAWVFDDEEAATELRLHYHDWPSPEPGSGVWRLPEPDDARLPLLYSLKATKG